MRSTALVSIVAAVCLTHGPMLSSAWAQTIGAERGTPVPVAKPAAAEPAKTAEKPPEGEAKPGDASTTGPRTAPGSGPLPVGSGERAFDAADCRWTGTRVVSRLMGEDVDAAGQFTRFYSLFGCPTPHIGKALTCMVDWDGDRKAQHEMIDECWKNPARKRTVAAPAAETAKEPGKPGTEDKPAAKN